MTKARLLIAASILLPALFVRCEAKSRYIASGPQSTHSTVIIFIHGWRGSSASWNSAHRGKSLPELIATDPVLARFADIYLFEYNSEGGDPKAELQGSIASKLGTEIWEMFKHGKKNIVLVCHSVGGIIAWTVIDQMHSFQILNDDPFAKVPPDRPFKMVFTFGTPYRGTSLPASESLAQMDQNKQLYALFPAEKNPFLNELEKNIYIPARSNRLT